MKFRNWLGVVAILFLSAYTPFGGRKTAYKAHYKGVLFYEAAEYQKAVRQFKKAYDILPDNFYFALTLSLSLSQSGKTAEGLKILTKGQYLLREREPDYLEKSALAHFYKGMIFCYAGQFKQALPKIKKGIQLQEKLGGKSTLSVMYNALGIAQLQDQGIGGNERSDLPPHYHVHKRDMIKSLAHFEKALELDKGNEAARKNYVKLCRYLEIEPQITSSQSVSINTITNQSDQETYIPTNIIIAKEFTHYDEVLFLLDISGSMVMEKVICKGTTRFEVMRESMLAILGHIPEKTSLGIGTIGGDCGTEPRLWHPIGELNRTDMRWKLRFLVPDGTTPLLSTLEKVPELFTDSVTTTKSIFLVSDGANVCSAKGLDICEWVQGLKQRGITINILTFLNTNFSNTNAFAEYTCLTDDTNGKILFFDNYRCKLTQYEFSLIESCNLLLPDMKKVNCWGDAVKDLWGIFPGEK